MKLPNTIIEWIDERIRFIKTITPLIEKAWPGNALQISEFNIAGENYKYCKQLYQDLQQHPDSADIKKRFKNIAGKLIFDTLYELDKQEYRCVSISGMCFPTAEKQILPQRVIDDIAEVRMSMSNIFRQVQDMVGCRKEGMETGSEM